MADPSNTVREMPGERLSEINAATPLDPELFRKAATAELERVMNFANHLVRGARSARTIRGPEDLVQETYLRAFRSAASFCGDPSGMRSWLFKILHNVFRSGFREGHHLVSPPGGTPQESLDTAAGELEPHDRGRTLDHGIDWEEVDDQLVSAVGSLPDDLRLVFLLLAGDGLKYREIAEVLEIPIGTVMSRISRARTLLMEKLKFGRSELNKMTADRVVPPEPEAVQARRV